MPSSPGSGAHTSAASPGWADPLNAALVTVLFIAPVVCGSAAAMTTSLRRRGVLQIAATAPGGLIRTCTLALATSAGWGLAAFGVSTVLLLARSDRAGPFTPQMLVLPLSGCVLIVSAAAVGASIGARFDSRAVAPALTLASFAAGYAVSFAHGRWLVLSPTFPATAYTVATQPHTALVATQIAVAASVALLSLTLSAGRPKPVALIGALVAVAASVVPVLRVDPHPVEFRTAPRTAPCVTDRGRTLCVWPADLSHAPTALVELAAVIRKVNGYWPTATAYREPGIVNPVPRAAVYDVISLDSTVATDYLPAAITAVLPPAVCPADMAADRARTDLYSWLQSGADTLSPVQRRTWVRARLDTLTRCRRR